MTPDLKLRDAQLALLLDAGADGQALANAQERMLRDNAFRLEAESLLRLGSRLSELGNALHDGVPPVALVDDVRDSIAHLAMEQLAVANMSPFAGIEHALAAMKEDFDAAAGSVSLVDDIMEAVAASRKSDEEVELPFLREASRLRRLGSDLAAESPPVDLVKPVEIEVTRRAAVAIVPLRARPSGVKEVRVAQARSRWPRAAGWAAAAMLCAAGAWFLYSQQTHQSGPSQLAGGNTPAPEVTEPVSVPDPAPPMVAQNTGEDASPSPGDTGTPPREGVGLSQTPPLTLQEVINARRADLVNDTRAVAALASLTSEEAIALLRDMDLSVEALIGATQFLSTEQAIDVLRAAILENPDDPQLRYALARSLEGDPAFTDERMDQLAQLAAKDPENGLPHYMLASDYLARGETGLALDALTRGSAYSDSSAYALEAARQREAALMASGLGPDVARLLALSQSGETEYRDITSLRNDLLDYGAYYEELGEYETARQIYNAVNQLGQQLAVGADMAVERQYGLETQQEAILAIQGIAEAFQDPQIASWIGDTLATLASGIADVAQYIQARQEMVTNPSLSNQVDWSQYLEHVIQQGDLNISDFFR